MYVKALAANRILANPDHMPRPRCLHPHWNYVCGTEVKLVTTRPFAKGVHGARR